MRDPFIRTITIPNLENTQTFDEMERFDDSSQHHTGTEPFDDTVCVEEEAAAWSDEETFTESCTVPQCRPRSREGVLSDLGGGSIRTYPERILTYPDVFIARFCQDTRILTYPDVS